MSFSLTTPQVRARTKTVTRRLGWFHAKPGMVVMACEKCQGIAKGGLVRLGPIRFTSVRREPLWCMDESDVSREGFPGWSVGNFISHFCESMKVTSGAMVTRIEFEYVDDTPTD
jgi:hypothetical protein